MGIFDQIKAAFTNTDEAPTKPLSKPDPQPEAPVGPASGQRKGNSYTVQSGDTLFKIAEEAYGDGVNIAARIEGLCVPGGVFLSGKTYDDIKNHPRLRAKSMGKFQLKNIQHGAAYWCHWI